LDARDLPVTSGFELNLGFRFGLAFGFGDVEIDQEAESVGQLPCRDGLSTGRFMSASVKMDEAYSFFRAGPACSLRPAQERIFGDVSARSPQVPDYALANVLKLRASPGPEFFIP
jgi:hypothetical protein